MTEKQSKRHSCLCKCKKCKKEFRFDANCPLRKEGNPEKITCPFLKTIIENTNDIKWLKKGYTVQILIGSATFIGMLALILNFIK